MDDIKNVCDCCGISAHVLTILNKHRDRPDKLKFSTSTYHMGICDFCGQMRSITEVRDFFYPDFNLLFIAMGKKKECDYCEGLGERRVSVEGDRGVGEIIDEECSKCKGTGVITIKV